MAETNGSESPAVEVGETEKIALVMRAAGNVTRLLMLRALQEADRGMGRAELAKVTDVTVPSATKSVEMLRRIGLVEDKMSRPPVPTRGPCYHEYFLTPLGRKVLEMSKTMVP